MTQLIETQVIESRFIFKNLPNNLHYVKDEEGQVLGFHKQENGNSVIFTKDLEGIEVAIEHCPDGTKIFHMAKDSKGLPAMHEFKPDGSEAIYLFDIHKSLEKMVEIKTNGDKITRWFSPKGETIEQEQRQRGGILFKMRLGMQEALIWLHMDGQIEAHGEAKLIQHLKNAFSKYLDGFEYNRDVAK
jgi:hypothetical protein